MVEGRGGGFRGGRVVRGGGGVAGRCIEERRARGGGLSGWRL